MIPEPVVNNGLISAVSLIIATVAANLGFDGFADSEAVAGIIGTGVAIVGAAIALWRTVVARSKVAAIRPGVTWPGAGQ